MADLPTPPSRRLDTGEHRVLLTVSGSLDPVLIEQIDDGTRPRPDYVELAKAMGADILDVTEARRRTGRAGRLIERLAGRPGLLAWACFRARRQYDAIFTDGEQVGMPLALLCYFGRRRTFAHVMLVHILSVPKKAMPFRWLRLGRHIDLLLVYASAQKTFITERLGVPGERVALTPFTVDTRFFAPRPAEPATRPMICTAGLEFRDYPTLIAAVRGLDVRLVIAAASNWSKRADSTKGEALPPNVEVCSLGFVKLRELYAEAAFVVMPMYETDFQAGITTILEAMSMGKAVICSRTAGQTDTIRHDETGLYVQPGDTAQLREAIIALVNDPPRAERLGQAARRYVEVEGDVSVYARRLAELVERAVAANPRSPHRGSGDSTPASAPR